MSLENLLRNDCPDYNKALRIAFENDPDLALDEARAMATAAQLYERFHEMPGTGRRTEVRPDALQKVIATFDCLPLMHKTEANHAAFWWTVMAIVETTSLTHEERELLGDVFAEYDWNDDTDLGSASFTALTARLSESPDERYIAIAVRCARDQAEQRLIFRLKERAPLMKPSRPFWCRWADSLQLAVG